MEDDKPRFGEFASKYKDSDMPALDQQGGGGMGGIGGGDRSKSEIERQLEDFQMQMAPKI